MQAPVTQATGPGRVRQSAWYFRRERGINCSQSVRARLGKAPTEGCREPSGLRRPKPTMPGRRVGAGRPRAARRGRRPRRASRWPTTTSGLRTSSQRPRAACQPALTPAANPPFSARATSRTPGAGGAGARWGPGPATRYRPPRPRPAPPRPRPSRARVATSRSDVGPGVVVDDHDRHPGGVDWSASAKPAGRRWIHAIGIPGSSTVPRFGPVRQNNWNRASVRPMEELEGNPDGGPPRMAGRGAVFVGIEPGAGPGCRSSPSPTPMDRWEPMNNPLELTGRVLATEPSGPGPRPDRGRPPRSPAARPLPGPGALGGLPVVGFVDAGHPRYSGRLGRGRQLAVHPQTDPVPVLGGIDRLDELVDRSRATHVVVAVSGRPAKRLWPRVAQLRNSDVAVHWVDRGRASAARTRAEADADADWTVARARLARWPGNGSAKRRRRHPRPRRSG